MKIDKIISNKPYKVSVHSIGGHWEGLEDLRPSQVIFKPPHIVYNKTSNNKIPRANVRF